MISIIIILATIFINTSFYVAGIVLSLLHVLAHLLPIINLEEGSWVFYYTHLMEGNDKAQTRVTHCPRFPRCGTFSVCTGKVWGKLG